MDETISGIEGEIQSAGVHVESVDVAADGIDLEYMTAFPGRQINHQEMGRVLNALIDRAEDGRWDPTRLDATVIRVPGDVMGTWHAERAWFEELLAYEISEEEFSARVLETIEYVESDGSDHVESDAEDSDHAGTVNES